MNDSGIVPPFFFVVVVVVLYLTTCLAQEHWFGCGVCFEDADGIGKHSPVPYVLI